ncbi:MAG: hypothetical protein ABII76_13700 [Pseudomonadota bacterium]
MKGELDPDSAPSVPAIDMRPYIGRVVRRQGNYGTISVVGRGGASVELLDDPKRLFPKDGQVEAQGVAHAALELGDWTEFGVVRNSRPRAPEYKTAHLRRLPRYAVLPESTPAGYRALLTKVGWRGERRGGLWALRMSGDRVLVVDLEPGKDGALRIPRNATRSVHWCTYRDDLVASITTNGSKEDVFLGDSGAPSGSFDWSDEADHVAQVIRSLADANDPRVADLITWLELHHEEGTGRVFAAAVDHDAAEATLRSGELAERLRADHDLMKVYLDAALEDDRVRDAVATWAREGHGKEAERLREELEHELELERETGIAQIATQLEARRAEEFARAEAEAAQLEQTRRAETEARLQDAETVHAERLRVLEHEFDRRREALEQQATEQASVLEAARAETEAAKGKLDLVRSDEAEARRQLSGVGTEIDRLLAIASRLDVSDRSPTAAVEVPATGVGHIFHARPQVSVAKKGALIAHQVLLTDHGKQLMRQLTTLMLAGELPLLNGGDAHGLLKVAEALLCPGRSASIEADPTVISVDDLWSRPGSGAPTALAAGAKAAKGGGAPLVLIRGIERSGARIWHPALADALRAGALPRGLLIACVVGDRGHEEIEALSRDTHLIEVEGALTDSAYLAGPTLLSPPALELETLDPGEAPVDLSAANPLLATLGFKPPLDLGLRIARIYVEGLALLQDKGAARSMVEGIARAMAERTGPRAP